MGEEKQKQIKLDAKIMNKEWQQFKEKSNLMKYEMYHELLQNREKFQFIYLIKELISPVDFINNSTIKKVYKTKFSENVAEVYAVTTDGEVELEFCFNKVSASCRMYKSKDYAFNECLYGRDFDPIRLLMYEFYKELAQKYSNLKL